MSAISKKILYAFFILYVLFTGGLLYWVIIMSGSTDGDTIEHVHSSWMVYNGKIPYVDFFQHHNPLLWYLGAPIIGMFEYSLRAVDAVNLITVTLAVVMMYYVYRMHKDFLTNSLGGLIAAGFVAFVHESLYIKDFKPDNYMTASLVIGVYYLFKYLKNKQVVWLFISFMLFFAAFMFTQKAVLILLCMGGIILYLLYRKQTNWSDVLLSAALPILIYVAFLVFLWSRGGLREYWLANFVLNSRIPDVFYTRRYIYPAWETFVPIVLCLYAMAKCLYNGSIYVRIIGALFIAEFIIRMYYFTPFVYYFTTLHAFASILAGVAAVNLINKRQWWAWVFASYFALIGAIYTNIYRQRITVGDSFKYGASGFLLELTNPCDYILNGYRIGYNLFNKDVNYIWNLNGQIDVIASTIGLHPLADLDTLIRKYRPKIIYGGNYYDTYREYRGAIMTYPIHRLSTYVLEEMYEPLNRDNLYILKPEYQSYDCRYNPRTKTYEYRDKH